MSERRIQIYGVDLNEARAKDLQAMFRSPAWTETLMRIMENISKGKIESTILNPQCSNLSAFIAAQSACVTLREIAKLPDLIDEELR